MKYKTTFKFILFGFICAFLATSCVKEGPMGPAGANGKDGTNGTNGTDGTAGCIVCHSDNQVIYAKELQYAASGHANGTAFERNTGECATCHTSQGFLGNLDGSYVWEVDGVEVDGAMIPNPSPQNCYTCHNIHSTYTAADLALTVSGPITLRNTNGATHDFGAGSLCASCHQGRTLDPWPVAGGDSIVAGSRYGIHHGPQGNLIAGVGMGLFEVGSGLVNSTHTSATNTCVTCHMGEAYGTQAGGHTLKMTYSLHGSEELVESGCFAAGCHQEGQDMLGLVEEFQTEIQVKLADLKTRLDAAGITSPGSDSNNKGKFSGLVAGAFVDYDAIVQDGSFGVHNPYYVSKLLDNLIEALDAASND